MPLIEAGIGDLLRIDVDLKRLILPLQFGRTADDPGGGRMELPIDLPSSGEASLIDAPQLSLAKID